MDLYLGSASTQSGDVEIGPQTAKHVTFDSSLTGGARIGAWIGGIPYVGLAVDGSYFTTDIPVQDVTVCISSGCAPGAFVEKSEQGHFGLSFELMLRLPLLAGRLHPQGRVQPYLSLGPALFASTWDQPGFTQARTVTAGFKGGAGAKMFLAEALGIFAEYRVTHFEPEQEFDNGIPFTASNKLTTHHIVGGIALEF